MRRGRRGIINRVLAKEPRFLDEIEYLDAIGASTDDIADYVSREFGVRRPDKSTVSRWLKRVQSHEK